MDRYKHIILVSHCVLNQNSVVMPLARAGGAYNQIVSSILDKNIGILQLPCPELIHLGMKRKPMSKEDYDTPTYRALCRQLLEPIMIQIDYYLEEDYHLIGLIGIDQSPTCSLDHKGILMEEFYALLDCKKIELDHIAVPTTYEEGKDTSFSHSLTAWIEEKL